MFRSATEESLRRLKVFEERSSSTGGASCDSRTVHQNRSGSTEGALEEFEARIRALERLSRVNAGSSAVLVRVPDGVRGRVALVTEVKIGTPRGWSTPLNGCVGSPPFQPLHGKC